MSRRGNVGRWATRRGVRDLGRSRRRIGGNFNPLTSIAWQNAWWASDPAWTAPADGAGVSTWPSTAARNLVQATGANQPLYRASAAGFNNKPCIEFDGVNDSLLDATFVGPTSDPYTVVCIARWLNAAPVATQATVSSWGSVAPGQNQYMARASNNAHFVRWPTVRTGTLVSADTTPHFLRSQIGTTVLARVDETAIGVTPTGTALATSALGVGATPTTASAVGAPFSNIQVAFVAFFSGDLAADPQWAAFKTWAATTYGITIA